MKLFHPTIRIIFGLILLGTAAAKLNILPNAANSPELFTQTGWIFIQAINQTGYIFPIIGIITLLCGISLLTNRYVALAAIILMPISANFLLFHLFTDHFFITLRGTPAYVFITLNVYMLYSERAKYTSLTS